METCNFLIVLMETLQFLESFRIFQIFLVNFDKNLGKFGNMLL